VRPYGRGVASDESLGVRHAAAKEREMLSNPGRKFATAIAGFLQGERVAYTKADGTFVLVNLPPGDGYRVVY
jgi:hypothetical protein